MSLWYLLLPTLALALAWGYAGLPAPRAADHRIAERLAVRGRAEVPPSSGVRLSPRHLVLACAVCAGDRAVPVPLLLRALQFPAGRRERTLQHARAALGELYQDGVIDLEPMIVPPGFEGFYLRGPEGRVFGSVTLAISLDEARAELARVARAEGLS